MFGSLKAQITAVLQCICRFGESRHLQKLQNNNQSPYVHAIGTFDKVAHWLWPLVEWLKANGIKDLELLNCHLLDKYLPTRLLYHQSKGNSVHTMQVELSALSILARALTEFSRLHRKIPIVYDFGPAIEAFRPMIRSLPKRTSPYTSRALPCPEEVIANMKNPKLALMAEIQLSCGCRTEGVGAPQRSYPGSSTFSMNNFILPEGNGIIQPIPDPITWELVYPFWTCEKGGKVALKHCPAALAERIFNWLDFNEEDLCEKYPVYLYAVNTAMRKAGQFAKGRGTHSLRFSFAQRRYLACVQSGMSDERAKKFVSAEMSHNRPEVTGSYLK